MRCKRCKKNYWSKDSELNTYPAISRRDNKTEICGMCGTEEALFDFSMANYEKSLKVAKEEESAWLNGGT